MIPSALIRSALIFETFELLNDLFKAAYQSLKSRSRNVDRIDSFESPKILSRNLVYR